MQHRPGSDEQCLTQCMSDGKLDINVHARSQDVLYSTVKAHGLETDQLTLGQSPCTDNGLFIVNPWLSAILQRYVCTVYSTH